MSTEFDIFHNTLNNPDFFSTASSVKYSFNHNDITLVMKSGIEIHIPLSHIGEFDEIPKAIIKRDISINTSGYEICIDSYNIHIPLKNLLKSLFGLEK